MCSVVSSVGGSAFLFMLAEEYDHCPQAHKSAQQKNAKWHLLCFQ